MGEYYEMILVFCILSRAFCRSGKNFSKVMGCKLGASAHIESLGILSGKQQTVDDTNLKHGKQAKKS